MSDTTDYYRRLAVPFRTKTVEAISLIPGQARLSRLEQAGFNVLSLRARDVFIDLFTDSGTSAMSDEQWSAIMLGDESYAGSDGFYLLQSAVEDLFGFKFTIPSHQGRAAQNLLYTAINRPNTVALSNTFYGGYLIHAGGGDTRNLVRKEAYDLKSDLPFKGDIDLDALRATIQELGPDHISAVIPVLTNNLGAGHPMSAENLAAVSSICRQHGIPIFLDACRIMENAFFIKEAEPGYRDKSIKEIVRQLSADVDGCIFSGKKDGLCNAGGFLALNSQELYEKILPTLLAIEGFITHGGMTGRDMAALAKGLYEAQQDDYLAERIGQVRSLAKELDEIGIPVIRPYSGSAVYINSEEFLDHLPRDHFRAECVAAAVFLEGGVRVGAFGELRSGAKSNSNAAGDLETVRLSLPRRVYGPSHMAVVREVFRNVYADRRRIGGLKIDYAPARQRFYSARLKPVTRQLW